MTTKVSLPVKQLSEKYQRFMNSWEIDSDPQLYAPPTEDGQAVYLWLGKYYMDRAVLIAAGEDATNDLLNKPLFAGVTEPVSLKEPDELVDHYLFCASIACPGLLAAIRTLNSQFGIPDKSPIYF